MHLRSWCLDLPVPDPVDVFATYRWSNVHSCCKLYFYSVTYTSWNFISVVYQGLDFPHPLFSLLRCDLMDSSWMNLSNKKNSFSVMTSSMWKNGWTLFPVPLYTNYMAILQLVLWYSLFCVCACNRLAHTWLTLVTHLSHWSISFSSSWPLRCMGAHICFLSSLHKVT